MRRDHALTGALAILLVALVLGPSLGDLTGTALGMPGDNLSHVWGQWWVRVRVLVDHAMPLTAERIWFPHGGGFFSLDTGGVLMTAPLHLLLEPVAAFNLQAVVQLLLAVAAGTALARRVGVLGPTATIAGVVFAFHAWVLAFPLASGVSEALIFWPLPLVAIGALDTLTRPGWRGPALLAPTLGFVALASPIYGVMGGLGTLGIGVGWLVTRPWKRDQLRRGLMQAAGTGALLLLLMVPLLLAIQGTTTGSSPIYPRESGVFSPLNPLWLPSTTVLSLSDLFMPGEGGLHQAKHGVDRLLYSGYLGFGVLGLAGFGVWKTGRPARLAALVGGLGVVLAMGVRIFADHALAGPSLWNPLYLALFHAMPLFHTTLHSVDRFLVPGMLGLGVAAAMGLRVLVQERPWRVQAAATVAAALLIVVEVIAVSPAPWPLPTTPAGPHPVSLALAQDARPGAVIDLPFRVDGFLVTDMLFQQTTHGRPIPYRMSGVGGEVVAPAVWGSALFQRAVTPLMEADRRRATRCEGAAELADAGFGWFIVRRDRMDAATGLAVEVPLRACLGDPEVYDNAALYRIDPSMAENDSLWNPRHWAPPLPQGVGGP